MVHTFASRVCFGDGDLFGNACYRPCEWEWAMVDTNLESGGLWSLEQWHELCFKYTTWGSVAGIALRDDYYDHTDLHLECCVKRDVVFIRCW